MKRLLTAILVGLISLTASAQIAINQVFLTLPDTICPYLGVNEKKFLIEYSNQNLQVEVDNLFGGKSSIISKSDNHLVLQATEGVVIEILLDKDGFYCITTACAPICSSVVNRYIGNWMFIERVQPPKEALFMKASVEAGVIVWTDETPNMLDDEEKKFYQ